MLLLAGITCSNAGLPDRAIEVCQKAVEMEADFIHGYTILAGSIAAMVREVEARAAAAEVLRINPDFSISGIVAQSPYRDPTVVERMVARLQKTGLPD